MFGIGISQTKIEKVDFVLGFFPEYDNQKCLIMMQFNIPDSLIPYNVNFKIPNFVESVFELDLTNNLKERQLNNKGNISLIINQSQYYCQFYIDINVHDSIRSIDYNLKLDKNLKSFFVLIQKPLESTNFNSFFTSPEVFNDEYNLTYHRNEFFNYLANDEFTIEFQYEKESYLTSMEILEKILIDHNHGNDLIGDYEDEHEITNNEDIYNKFYRSKYLSFLFGIPLILIVLLIYFFYHKNNTNIDFINDDSIKFCSNCSEKYLKENKQKFCKKCGSGLNVS